jgi:hypothetical protein
MITLYNLPKNHVFIDGREYWYEKETRHKQGDGVVRIYEEKNDKRFHQVFYITEMVLDILSNLDEDDILYFAMKKKKTFLITDFNSYVKFFRPETYEKYRLLFE